MNKIKGVAGTAWLLICCTALFAQRNSTQSQSDISKYGKMSPAIEADLKKFDTLDFVVYSNQEWERLHESHDKNIKVVMPDGSITVGLEAHIKALKWMFTFAPDTKIKEHPIRFGAGNYTAVEGYMEGTFTKPMTKPDGTTVPPTNKHFKLPMVTIGIWKNGLMIEEHLFWDNMAFMKQIDLAK